MKLLLSRLIVFLLLIICFNQLNAQLIYYNTDEGDLYTINPFTCDIQFITSLNLPNGDAASFEDIAFTEDGTLIGIDNGTLYSINLTTGNATNLGLPNISGNVYALVGIEGNTLYAASSSLYFIDIDAGTIDNLGGLPQNAAGDLAFNNGELYMAAQGDGLLQIDTNDPINSSFVGEMQVSGSIFGIVSYTANCDETYTYATSSSNDLYLVDVNTADITLPCTDLSNDAVYGAATTTELIDSACSLELDLDENDSNSQLNDVDFYADTLCSNLPTLIVDSDVLVNTDEVIDSITIQISSGILDAPNEGLSFIDNLSDIDFISNTDGSITLINLGSATTQNFQDALLAISFNNTDNNYSDGTRIITITAFADNLNVQANTFIVLVHPPVINVTLGDDAQLCDQSQYTLDATVNIPNLTYQWNDIGGSTNPILSVSTSGMYIVNVTDNTCGVTDADTINIQFNNSYTDNQQIDACMGSQQFFDGNLLDEGLNTFQYQTLAGCDSIIEVNLVYHAESVLNLNNVLQLCDQNQYTIDASVSSPNVTYLWSDQSTNSALTVFNSGTYSVEITDTICGNITDVIEVIFSNSSTESESILACTGDEAYFDGNLLDEGLNTFQYQTTAGCDSVIDVTLSYHPELVVNIIEDTLQTIENVAVGIETEIDTQIQNINWSNSAVLSCSDCPNPTATPVTTTMFELTAIDENSCVYTDNILVQVETIEPETEENLFVIPNTFTPNNDGFNDKLNIGLLKPFSSFKMNVFNRWGQNVFQQIRLIICGTELLMAKYVS